MDSDRSYIYSKHIVNVSIRDKKKIADIICLQTRLPTIVRMPGRRKMLYHAIRSFSFTRELGWITLHSKLYKRYGFEDVRDSIQAARRVLTFFNTLEWFSS